MREHSDWRDQVIAREKSEDVNCKRCKFYLPRGEKPPHCGKWGNVIGPGFSGARNDAPFCQFYTKEKP